MGATEIIFIFVVYLLLFGAKGIPSLAQTLGQAVRTFRNATEDIQREILSDAAPRRADVSNVREVNKTMGDGPLPQSDPSTRLNEDSTDPDSKSGTEGNASHNNSNQIPK
ncbi:MAG: twin-arginine translocase TatA/TatE family subunit [Bacteroidetes bacterium]|nr:twin-arginine translocase TatA/TatE family subunit [Bacteroidota bacterium]MDA0903292.1 twin-arginine translocase TatA/TatE family subunit [Bacteroidota bacterium]MDA1242149.1 twin-arginine translocase TatA/TatE family subunit [Bacteroidota bacterium]